MFITQLFIGMILIGITVVIHAVALDFLLSSTQIHKNKAQFLFRRYWKIPILVYAVLGVFFAHVVQIWIWALFYLYVDILPTLESALYFSTSTFTTVGFGDIILNENWRLISAFQSANGFILFGWSTAFIFEVVSHCYKSDFSNRE